MSEPEAEGVHERVHSLAERAHSFAQGCRDLILRGGSAGLYRPRDSLLGDGVGRCRGIRRLISVDCCVRVEIAPPCSTGRSASIDKAKLALDDVDRHRRSVRLGDQLDEIKLVPVKGLYLLPRSVSPPPNHNGGADALVLGLGAEPLYRWQSV